MSPGLEELEKDVDKQEELFQDPVRFRRWLFQEHQRNKSEIALIHKFGCDANRARHVSGSPNGNGNGTPVPAGSLGGEGKWGKFFASGIPMANMVAAMAMVLVVVMGIVMAVVFVKVSKTAATIATNATEARDLYARAAHRDSDKGTVDMRRAVSNAVEEMKK